MEVAAKGGKEQYGASENKVNSLFPETNRNKINSYLTLV